MAKEVGMFDKNNYKNIVADRNIIIGKSVKVSNILEITINSSLSEARALNGRRLPFNVIRNNEVTHGAYLDCVVPNAAN